MEESLKSLLYKYNGRELVSIQAFPQSGSSRRYFRLSDGKTSYVGVVGTDVSENEAFIYLANHFSSKGISVPEVYAVSEDRMCYLQEDLGSVSLYDSLPDFSLSEDCRQTGILEKTILQLAKMHFEGAEELDFKKCHPFESFTRDLVLFDLNYFKYCFLKPSSLTFNEVLLQQDFEHLADDIMNCRRDVFMYRDFQSRNVIVKEDCPYFIDFQGGMRGPMYYDVVSFLWQAKAAYPDDLKEHLMEVYLSAAERYTEIDRNEFKSNIRLFVLLRTLQVLGAYGFRGNYEKKVHFIQSIPYALENLEKLLMIPFDDYPYLTQVLSEMVSALKPKYNKIECAGDRLCVTIYSFSYKKGIPDDISGNGGGYIFDCRGIHNPGRYEPYKKLTGMDRPVIDFLESESDVAGYLNSVYSIVDKHVEDYISRGFKNLMVCFGCTGGQHRSVYCAEHLFEHLAEKFDVDIRLEHREQKQNKVRKV